MEGEVLTSQKLTSPQHCSQNKKGKLCAGIELTMMQSRNRISKTMLCFIVNQKTMDV
jgi:hypothetical protein